MRDDSLHAAGCVMLPLPVACHDQLYVLCSFLPCLLSAAAWALMQVCTLAGGIQY